MDLNQKDLKCVAFSDSIGYTGKPKGVDEHEAIYPAKQDEQTPTQEV